MRRRLQSEEDTAWVRVIRNGSQQITVRRDIVVGDIIQLAGGAVIADCILLHGNQLEVNEQAVTGKQDAIPKAPFESDRLDAEDPYVYAGSLIVSGAGMALVCAVGSNIRHYKALDEGLIKKKAPEISPMQHKTESVADQLVRMRRIFLVLTFWAIVFFLVINARFMPKQI